MSDVVVGYVRLSRDDDKKNYISIENQKALISKYASENNMEVSNYYEDDGVSGYIFDETWPHTRDFSHELGQIHMSRKNTLKLHIILDFYQYIC